MPRKRLGQILFRRCGVACVAADIDGGRGDQQAEANRARQQEPQSSQDRISDLPDEMFLHLKSVLIDTWLV